MKKYILIALALSCAIVALAGEYIRWVDLTETGDTLVADGKLTAQSGRVTSVLAIYQDVLTETNTVVVKQYLSGATTNDAVTLQTLGAITNATSLVKVGEGDVTADVDDIILTGGDVLWLSGTGATYTNVGYKVLIKETNQ